MTDATLSSDGTDGADELTIEELLDQAAGNAQALIAASVMFAKKRGIPLSEWTAELGEIFGTAWDKPQPWNADEFLDAMLTNLRSLGADLVDRTGTADLATARIAGFPSEEICAMLNADPADVACYLDTTTGIARERGLEWSWAFDSGEIDITVRRIAG